MSADFSKLERAARLKLIHLYGGELTARPGDVLGPRRIKDFELLYILEGSAEYRTEGKSWHVPAGGLVLGRPGPEETYLWGKAQSNRHAYFHFHIEAYPTDWPDPRTWPRVWTAPSQLARSLFKQIVQNIYQNDSWPAEPPGRSDCAGLELLVDLFIQSAGAPARLNRPERPEPLRRALELMSRTLETDPAHALSLAELAAEAHVSEKHLCRLFTSSVGYPPLKTFILLKLQGAWQLLSRTNLSVKEVSERCGFNSQFYFSRCFSKTFGISPSAVRATSKQEELIPPENPLPQDLIPKTYW